MELTLVGTGHVFDIGGLVREIIRSREPVLVCVELDPERLRGLGERRNIRLMKERGDPALEGLLAQHEEARRKMPFVYRWMAEMQERIADEYGVEPGGELLAAADAARAYRLPVACIDVEARALLARAWKAMGWWERFKFLGGLLFQGRKSARHVKRQERQRRRDARKNTERARAGDAAPQGDAVPSEPPTGAQAPEHGDRSGGQAPPEPGRGSSVEDEIGAYENDPLAYIAKFGDQFPSLKRVLIDDRDSHMAGRLIALARIPPAPSPPREGGDPVEDAKQARDPAGHRPANPWGEGPPERIVAVVGDGHVEGMLKHVRPELGEAAIEVIRLQELRRGDLPPCPFAPRGTLDPDGSVMDASSAEGGARAAFSFSMNVE